MSGIATQSYARVALDTGVRSGDPHQLVLMLYDGALAAVNQARSHLQTKRVADKGAAIGKAIRIIDEGLKISLDRKAGGELAGRLLTLYDYLVMRLLQANLRSDESALIEVTQRLVELRDAWASIRPAVTPAQAGASPAVQPTAATSDAPPRRLVVSA